MARNSAKNSAKFALELSIRQMIYGSSGPTASGNLVVDRTETGFAQHHWRPGGMPPSGVRGIQHVYAIAPCRRHYLVQFGSQRPTKWRLLMIPIQGSGRGLAETIQPVHISGALADI